MAPGGVLGRGERDAKELQEGGAALISQGCAEAVIGRLAQAGRAVLRCRGVAWWTRMIASVRAEERCIVFCLASPAGAETASNTERRGVLEPIFGRQPIRSALSRLRPAASRCAPIHNCSCASSTRERITWRHRAVGLADLSRAVIPPYSPSPRPATTYHALEHAEPAARRRLHTVCFTKPQPTFPYPASETPTVGPLFVLLSAANRTLDSRA